MFKSLRTSLLALVWIVLVSGLAGASDIEGAEQDLPALIQSIFPEATDIMPQLEHPRVWPVYQVTELVGYAFLSGDYVQLPGFSGAPFQLLVGIDREGRFRGVQVLEQHEPIFLHGLGTGPMHEFTRQYLGLDLRHSIKLTSAAVHDKHSGSNVYIDGISKATVSAVVLNETVIQSALQVAQETGIIARRKPPARVREDLLETTDWQQLLEQHWVGSVQIPEASVEAAFKGNAGDTPIPHRYEAGAYFANLQFAYLNVPTIGRYLLGDRLDQRLMENLEPGDQVIAVMNQGPYSVLGDDFTRGTPSDRLALDQGGVQIELRDMDFFNALEQDELDSLPHAGMPRFNEFVLFRVKAGAGLDPASGWTLSLVVARPQGYLRPDEIRRFGQEYRLPARLFSIEASHDEPKAPLWLQIWQENLGRIAVLLLGLALLTTIILAHRRVTQNARRFRLIRWGYLLYTLIFIGYITQGQLSITNVFAILQVMAGDVSASVLLLDPVICILWCYVLLTLVLWGRGYFCGWLCPFGVLQELSAELARVLKIRQRRIPFRLHRRLQGLKYLILAGLVATSFWSISGAERAAEVEPFKTAITLGFVRDWPFVLYASALLLAGLFVHKFFCRYLCPLGACFAVLGHFHLLRWLPRRAECGSPCQLCTRRCGIGAIEPDGRINYRECIQCYECEVIYRDDQQCVPLINARKGRRRAAVVIASQ
ncbi:NosR/NirI family protein [Pseudomonas sp. GCEP-101]|uniref:NosR/NirI family protein n=1 Tax=Pseudomonas sp. GCEP-101 TaxID=2974552 RepID=UPI00223B82E9|nr:NosR/NirI family protein [Pseudomonas sp. GCEP-101]